MLRDLFEYDVTRDIPPVVYFHEQDPARVAAEVREYIVTGGWPENHPSHRRVPSGIHEQYVRLLTNIVSELNKTGGPELPASWISGFYGSGKSIFAKLLGLSLDGMVLPDGSPLGEAWLGRDLSPRAAELRAAYQALLQQVQPIAVVFDIGGAAKDGEQVHSAVARMVQRRLGYCSTSSIVADFELRLERDGEWKKFEAAAQQALGKPWSEVKDRHLAEQEFSVAMAALFPDRYTDPMSWCADRLGTAARFESVDEATRAVADMLRFRAPGKTLFVVVDEVSQYVLSSQGRIDALRAFVSELGARLKGRAWLLALGQQKIEDESGETFLSWAKDRFPKNLRVHLAPTNIRDVVHRRLLQKKEKELPRLRELFRKHRQDLQLFAYGCESLTEEDFCEVYPMLPGHVDLLLQITSAIRSRSTRSQGDDQAIRGLLQMLGELFRERKLAEREVGSLVTLDEVYEVQHTALDADVQASMARILVQCSGDESGLLVRVAKTVALLELLQETLPTDARLVAACLYDRVDRGSQVSEVTAALEELRRRNLLSFSEKTGYKLQSSAGEEWEHERRVLPVAREQISDSLLEILKRMLGEPELPRLQGRSFPWAASFSDGRRARDLPVVQSRDEAPVHVDFRFVIRAEQAAASWLKLSAEAELRNRLLWVCGDVDNLDERVRELVRSQAMFKRYAPRKESLAPARKLLLQQEENRSEELTATVREEIAKAWMAGAMYFRGRELVPGELGSRFALAMTRAGTDLLPDLFPHFDATALGQAELMQLVDQDLTGVSPKFMTDQLGILDLDAGRYVPSCSGVVPTRVLEFIKQEQCVGGTTLLAHFGGPPFGYTPGVVKACVAGLLRGGHIKLQTEEGDEVTSTIQPGVRDLFDKDRPFRRASMFPADEDDVGRPARARICRFFDEHLGVNPDREDLAIAEAVAQTFPEQAARLRSVLERLNRLPGKPATPAPLLALERALEDCVRVMRKTREAVRTVKRHLDALRDGMQVLALYDAELTEPAIAEVRAAGELQAHQLEQLRELGPLSPEQEQAASQVDAQLASERPWQDIASLRSALDLLRAAYGAERGRLIAGQEEQAEAARGRVKRRKGCDRLDADHSHQVLRPIALAVVDTTAEAVAPKLSTLRDGFAVALHRAEEQANEILDELLSQGAEPVIEKLDLRLRNRELHTVQDLEALLDEIRGRLEPRIRSGARVRLI